MRFLKHLPLAMACSLTFLGTYTGVVDALSQQPAPKASVGEPTVAAPVVAEPAAPITLSEITVVGTRPARKARTIRNEVPEARPVRCEVRELIQGSGVVRICQ